MVTRGAAIERLMFSFFYTSGRWWQAILIEIWDVSQTPGFRWILPVMPRWLDLNDFWRYRGLTTYWQRTCPRLRLVNGGSRRETRVGVDYVSLLPPSPWLPRRTCSAVARLQYPTCLATKFKNTVFWWFSQIEMFAITTCGRRSSIGASVPCLCRWIPGQLLGSVVACPCPCPLLQWRGANFGNTKTYRMLHFTDRWKRFCDVTRSDSDRTALRWQQRSDMACIHLCHHQRWTFPRAQIDGIVGVA